MRWPCSSSCTRTSARPGGCAGSCEPVPVSRLAGPCEPRCPFICPSRPSSSAAWLCKDPARRTCAGHRGQLPGEDGRVSESSQESDALLHAGPPGQLPAPTVTYGTWAGWRPMPTTHGARRKGVQAALACCHCQGPAAQLCAFAWWHACRLAADGKPQMPPPRGHEL